MCRDIIRGRNEAMIPIIDFLQNKNWLCWDVLSALFNKATLFSLPEVFGGLPELKF